MTACMDATIAAGARLALVRRFDAREALDLIERELGTDRRHALALASVAVDLAVTQLVNDAKGVHAILRDDRVQI